MSKKLYIGSLSYDTTEDTLKNLFSQAGNVASVAVIMDRMTGRSKGFGFVEMTSDEEALAAIEMYNGKDIDGRKVTVNEARPLEPRAPRAGGFKRGAGAGGGTRGGFGGGNRRRDW